MTNPHIGNYGVYSEDVESEGIKIAGLVTKNFSPNYSRPIGTQSLGDYLVENNKIGITEIDTRALVRHVRNAGAMNAIISTEISDIQQLKALLQQVPSMEGLELSSKVATKEAYVEGDENAVFRVSMVDFGLKKNIVRCLTERGCLVKIFPMDCTTEDLLSFHPHGIMLSNGPGDPSVMTKQINLVAQIVALNLPTFGICLGHQLLALSQGLKTVKMHKGHRGLNHPVKNLKTGRGEITSQNHGFVVSKESIEECNAITLTHVHLNDDTVAGMEFKDKKIFSVQYHPEASAGPHDSRYLFDQFINNMKAKI
jgi:carbamoyl-phosphate synthase small subunit